MTSITSNMPIQSSTAPLNDVDLGPNGSVQIMFAKLQLLLSGQCKAQAEKYMADVQDIQKNQKNAADLIARLRDKSITSLKAAAADPAFKELLDWAASKGIKLEEDHKANYDFNLKSLSNYQDTVGNRTQTLMVYLQDFIGQYNSFLQGASSSINDAKNVLASIARGQ